MPRSRARLIVVLFVVAAAAVAIRRLDAGAIRGAFAETSWGWAAAAAGVNLLSVVIDAARWRAIIAGVRPVRLLHAVEGLLVGWMGNLLVPMKLGEGAKAWVLARRVDLPLATVLSTVLLDRTMDAATFVVYVALVGAVAPLPADAGGVRAGGVLGLAAVAAGVIGGRAWVRARRRRGVAPIPAATRLGRIAAGFAILGDGRRLVPVAGWALLAWFTRMWVVWCVMRAFHLHLPVAAAASTLAIINLGITAVAAPGNFGVFELASAGALALWHVPGEIGVSFGIALHAIEVLPIVAIGLLVQSLTGLSRRRLNAS